MNARVKIETAERAGKTIVANMFYTPPFKVMPFCEDPEERKSVVMLMSASPGILADDTYTFSYNITDNCSLKIVDQSFQRIFSNTTTPIQKTKIHIGNHSHFHYISKPVVPHKHASITVENQIHVSKTGALIWGGILCCGRGTQNEVFAYDSYHEMTQIFIEKQLYFYENVCLNPAQKSLHSIGQFEGYTHTAMLVCINPRKKTGPIKDHFKQKLAQLSKIEYGVTSLRADKGILVKVMGFEAEPLYELLCELAEAIA